LLWKNIACAQNLIQSRSLLSPTQGDPEKFAGVDVDLSTVAWARPNDIHGITTALFTDVDAGVEQGKLGLYLCTYNHHCRF